MQIDLHHGGTYALCRLAGMKSMYAKIVAYCAQQVDDATHGHALKFENGGAFRQTLTAHRGLSTRNFNVNDALEVWMPFHFIPAGLSPQNPDGLIAGPNSMVLNLLLKHVSRSSDPQLILYQLGIALHCFADSFTHQDFKGFFDVHNNVRLLKGVTKKGPGKIIEETALDILNHINFPFFAIGHAEVLANPDIPYATWSYTRKNQKTIVVDNLNQRFLPALRAIYTYLVYFLKKNPAFAPKNWLPHYSFNEDLFIKLLRHRGSTEERHQNWLEHIKTNFFQLPDFDKNDQTLDYQPREWFKNAVKAIKVQWWKKPFYEAYNYHLFHKQPGFDFSDWVKFMQAAAGHKFTLIHKILPQCGIYVG